MARVGWILLSAVLVLGLSRDCPAQASFTGLGHLGNGPDSQAFAVSADGSVVVGTSDSPAVLGGQAFHWQGGVMTPLAGLRPLYLSDEAHDVSADGTRIVGFAESTSNERHAVVWEGVLAAPTDLGPERVRGLSGDGTTAVGQTPVGVHSVLTPVLWDEGDPNSTTPLDPNSLELLDPNAAGGAAYAVTTDGSLIVGSSLWQAFRWRNGVMERLPGLGALDYLDPNLPLDPGVSSIAFDVSSDGGSVVVGSTGGIPLEAFHWRASGADGVDGDLIPLGSLWDPNHTGDPNTIESQARGVSADGRVVVGWSLTPSVDDEAFIWSGEPYMEYPNARMQNLKAVLEGHGLDLSGWVLQRAEDVSADGRTIVGWGINSNPADPNLPPDPHTEAWIAVLPPSTATLCGDTNDDGYVYLSDIDALRRALADPSGQALSAGGLSKCSVIGAATSCDAVDVVVLQRVLAYDIGRIRDGDTPWLPPPIADVCEALASP